MGERRQGTSEGQKTNIRNKVDVADYLTYTYCLYLVLSNYIRVPKQVLQSLIFVFPFVRPYKVLYLGYFHPKGLIFYDKGSFRIKKCGSQLELRSPKLIINDELFC